VPLLLLVVTACGVPETAVVPTARLVPTPICRETAAGYVDAVRPLFNEWNDAVQLATRASRLSLAGPVGDLQELRRRVQAVDVPACAERAQSTLIKHMDAIIDAQLGFMAHEDAVVIERHFEESRTSVELFGLLFAELRSPGH